MRLKKRIVELATIDESQKLMDRFIKNSKSKGISSWVKDIMNSLWNVGVRQGGGVLEGLCVYLANNVGKKWGFDSTKYQPKLNIRSKQKGDFSWEYKNKTIHFEVKTLIENGNGAQSINKLKQIRKEIEGSNVRFIVIALDACGRAVKTLKEDKGELKEWIFIARENVDKLPSPKDSYVKVEKPEHEWAPESKSKPYWYRSFEPFGGESFIENAFLRAKKHLTGS